MVLDNMGDRFMKRIFHTVCLLLAAAMPAACDNTDDNAWQADVSVETITTSDITATSVISGGHISGDTGKVASFGVCWGTSPEPTLNDSYEEADGLPESYACYILGLSPATTCYVRAYAIIATDTVYGTARRFTTQDENGNGGGEDEMQLQVYLWPEDNMPTITNYTVNNGNYPDNPDFRPNMVWYPVPEGTEVKGAVMVCPGGAFMFRSPNEGEPVAERLA